MKGVVDWFDEKKGFGFIIGEDEKSYFVHFKDIALDGFKTLQSGDSVEFSSEDSPKGKKALGVKII